MSNDFNPTPEEIGAAQQILIQYRSEYHQLFNFCKKYDLDRPAYEPPIDPRFTLLLKSPYAKLKDGSIKPLPFWMNKNAFRKFINPTADKFQPMITTAEWEALMEADPTDDDIARLILGKYSDFRFLVLRECMRVYDPIFHRIVSGTGYFTDWKSMGRLEEDWQVMLPIAITLFIKQLRVAYRKFKGGYSTFFQVAFFRIFYMLYLKYCRDFHKEDKRYNIAPHEKFLKIEPGINPEDCPALTDPTIFDNELYYHVLNKLKPLDAKL